MRPGATRPSQKRIARDIRHVLGERLPRGWSLSDAHNGQLDRACELIEVSDPDGRTALLALGVKRTLEPRLAEQAAALVKGRLAEIGVDAVPIVAASYLSSRAREILEDLGVGYLDTTGNIHVEVRSPGLFIEAQGAGKDPWHGHSDLRSLRGRGAAKALRAIIDTPPPFGVRELATVTSASAPTLSRVLDLLEREAVVVRQQRGPVLDVDWRAAIRRWAEDYDQLKSNTPTLFLDPSGLPSIEKKLVDSGLTYAATGAFAAQRFDPIAPARVATIYVNDTASAAAELGLRETESGANAVLLEPFDPVVFDRTIDRSGLCCVAPSQLSVDLLTGPGREPSQGEEILVWMRANRDVWQA